jgi:hypothetical protein
LFENIKWSYGLKKGKQSYKS